MPLTSAAFIYIHFRTRHNVGGVSWIFMCMYACLKPLIAWGKSVKIFVLRSRPCVWLYISLFLLNVDVQMLGILLLCQQAYILFVIFITTGDSIVTCNYKLWYVTTVVAGCKYSRPTTPFLGLKVAQLVLISFAGVFPYTFFTPCFEKTDIWFFITVSFLLFTGLDNSFCCVKFFIDMVLVGSKWLENERLL